MLSCALVAHAQGFDAQRYLPPVGSAGGLLIERPTLRSSARGTWAAVFSYAEDAIVYRDGHEVYARPVRALDVLDLMGTITLDPAFEIGVDVPLFVGVQGDPWGGLDGREGLGDIRVVPKVGLPERPRRDQLLLGFAVPIRFPTGSPYGLRGSGTVTFEPQLLFGIQEHRFRLHGQLGYRARPGLAVDSPVGDEVTFGAGLAFGAIREEVGVDVLLEWLGAADLTRPDDYDDVPLEVLGGFEWRSRSFAFTAAAGPGLTGALGTPDFRIVLGLRLSPAVRGHARATSGWRRPTPAVHRVEARDADGDGLANERDACPSEPEGIVHGDGDGCPDRQRLGFVPLLHHVDAKVQFDAGSAAIDRAGAHELDAFAHSVRDRTVKGHVYVLGHSDNLGSPHVNEALSLRRAKNVCAALIDRGLDPDRLVPRAYGDRRPLAPNDTPAGRALNRRVEILLKD